MMAPRTISSTVAGFTPLPRRTASFLFLLPLARALNRSVADQHFRRLGVRPVDDHMLVAATLVHQHKFLCEDHIFAFDDIAHLRTRVYLPGIQSEGVGGISGRQLHHEKTATRIAPGHRARSEE